MRRNTLSLILALVFALVSVAPITALASENLVSADTPLSGSTSARLNNVQLAADAIDGTRVNYGETFSFNSTVGPRTTRYGFQSAINGRGVKVVGGGVAQVASTLYLALKQLDGIEYDERKTYGTSYNGKYVQNSRDAILVEYPGTDFQFTNYYGGFDINMWVARNRLYCSLSLKGNGRAIGSASIPIDGNRNTRTNVTLAVDSICDTQLMNGDVFSFNDIVGPRVSKYGFRNAVNGRGVTVTGGGVAQVASCVYLAIKNLDCVRITERSTYGARYTQSYVQNGRDAILVDYNAKLDFRFKYVGKGTLCIYTYVDGMDILCDVYEDFG